MISSGFCLHRIMLHLTVALIIRLGLLLGLASRRNYRGPLGPNAHNTKSECNFQNKFYFFWISVKTLKCAKQYFIVDLNIFQDAKTFYIIGILFSVSV